MRKKKASLELSLGSLQQVAADFTKKLIGNQFKGLLSLAVNYE